MKTILLLILLCGVTILTGCYKVAGCTDKNASNYLSTARVDDGSCEYSYNCCYYDENGVKIQQGCVTQDMTPEVKADLEQEANSSVSAIGWSFKCE